MSFDRAVRRAILVPVCCAMRAASTLLSSHFFQKVEKLEAEARRLQGLIDQGLVNEGLVNQGGAQANRSRCRAYAPYGELKSAVRRQDRDAAV